MDALITLCRRAYLLFDQYKLLTCWVLAVAITITMGQYFKPNTTKIVGSIDFHQVTLRSEVAALVKRVDVKVGDKVSEGQVLAVLSNEALDAEITEVRHQLDLAKSQSKARKAIDLRFRVKSLKSKLTHLENKKSTLKMVAPISGFVSEVLVQPGALNAPFTPLITIDDPASKTIKAYVHENVTDVVAVGKVFKVSAWNERKKSAQARVVSVSERIAPFPKRLQPETVKGQFWGREVVLESDSKTPFLLGELLILDSEESSFSDFSHVWEAIIK